MINDKLIQLSVPCNGCKMCCKSPNLSIIIRNEKEALLYNTFVNDKNEYEILRKSNGECIYLTATGCGIYEQRPTTCKDFDCRGYAIMNSVGEYDRSIAEKGNLMLKKSGGLKAFAEYLIVRDGKEANKSDIFSIHNVLLKRKILNPLIDTAIHNLEKDKMRQLFIQKIDAKVQHKLQKLNRHKNKAHSQALCAISSICRYNEVEQRGNTFTTTIDQSLLDYLLLMQKKMDIDDLILSRVIMPLTKLGHSDAIDCHNLIKKYKKNL